mmetsp:Transcript_32430/g.74943  ORF Transcript_32430/g.74943 Transcript_32430/m.74943 type:complete len:204 (+) Transcript_32430:777-1388(+)
MELYKDRMELDKDPKYRRRSSVPSASLGSDSSSIATALVKLIPKTYNMTQSTMITQSRFLAELTIEATIKRSSRKAFSTRITRAIRTTRRTRIILTTEKLLIIMPVSEPAKISVSVTTSINPRDTTNMSRRFQCISSLQMKKRKPSATQRITKSRKNARKKRICATKKNSGSNPSAESWPAVAAKCSVCQPTKIAFAKMRTAL